MAENIEIWEVSSGTGSEEGELDLAILAAAFDAAE